MDLWTWDRFAAVAADMPDRIAVRHGQDAISFGALRDGAEALAASLPIGPGDRAIVSAPNAIPSLVFIAAIWR
ncbi:MAG: amino acid adenylation protein, partial [Thioclava sp.]